MNNVSTFIEIKQASSSSFEKHWRNDVDITIFFFWKFNVVLYLYVVGSM